MATQTVPLRRAANLLWLRWGLAGLLGFVGGIAIKTAIEIAAEAGNFTTARCRFWTPPIDYLVNRPIRRGCAGSTQRRSA